MTELTLDTRERLDRVGGSAQSFVRSGAVCWAQTLRTRLVLLASRVSVAVGGLALSFGCVEVRVVGPDSRSAIPAAALFFLALALFLVFCGILAFVSRRRRRRRLAKILVAVLAGSACGALWVLIVDTVVSVARPGAMMGSAGMVGVVTGLSAAILLARPGSLSEVVGRSWIATGFHSLALPVVALVSFLVGGAQLSPTGSARPELSAVILGVRLAGSIVTVGLSVVGLVLGLFLVSVGDRALRRARSGRTDVPRGRRNLDRFRD